MHTITLTPNRTTPQRYTRIVCYRQEDNVVKAYRWTESGRAGEGVVDEIAFRDIAPSTADFDLVRAWGDHVAAETAAGRDRLTFRQRRT